MSNIKYFSIYFVGLIRREEDTHPLGFMTPYEKTKQFEKRKSTIENWMFGSFGYKPSKDYKNVTFIKNELRNNFKILKNVTHGNSPAGNVWRIYDPYGFELEISSKNLDHILQNSSIINGVIEQPCMWGRIGAENFLVVKNTDMYNKLMDYKNPDKKISVTDLKPGNKITLKAGTNVTYLGKFKLFLKPYSEPPYWSEAHFVKTKTSWGTECVMYYKNINVNSITDSGSITIDESLDIIHENIKDNNSIRAAGNSYDRVLRVEKENHTFTFELREFDKSKHWDLKSKKLVHVTNGLPQFLLLSNDHYTKFLQSSEPPVTSGFRNYGSNDHTVTVLDEAKLDNQVVKYYTQTHSLKYLYATITNDLKVYDLILKFSDGTELNMSEKH